MDDDISASGPLPHMGLLRFAGTDAAGFLQGQLSNDTRRLSAGFALLAAYSSPQGRVLAVLHLLPHSSGIIALMPRDIVAPTLERLRKFVLRSKVQLADLSDQFSVFGLHGAEDLVTGGLPHPEAASAYAEVDGIGVARVGPQGDRFWAIGERESLTHRLPKDRAVTSVQRSWRLADIRDGLPQVYSSTQELFVAQMLNLDLIDGISFTKGCFTGQEIIARTQHLGRIKRRMFRLRLPAGEWTIGRALKLTDGRAGRLIEVAASGESAEALAVLNLEAGGSGSGPGGAGVTSNSDADPESSGASVDAEVLPLPYSLSPAT
jgi:folate-binding protein YgfZ